MKFHLRYWFWCVVDWIVYRGSGTHSVSWLVAEMERDPEMRRRLDWARKQYFPKGRKP